MSGTMSEVRECVWCGRKLDSGVAPEAGWIDARDQLPPKTQIPEEYLISFMHRRSKEVGVIVSTGYWYSDHWEDGMGDILDAIIVQHWQPLPVAPKSVEESGQ